MLGALATGGLGLGLGALGNMFGSSGAEDQEALMRDAMEQQLRMFKNAKRYTEGIGKQTREDLTPYRNLGAGQTTALQGMLDNPAISSYVDPGLNFRLQTGTNAINNAAASRGMQLSGDTLRALQEFGQDMGSQEYGNAFNRWAQEAALRQGVSQQGQQAAVQTGELGNQNAGIVMGGATNAGANYGNMAQGAAQYAGAGDRMWGNYFGGLGGMAMGGAGSMMGGAGGGLSGILNSFKGPGFGAAAPYQSGNWLGAYGK